MPGEHLIYPGVSLPPDAVLGPFVVVGEPPRGAKPGDLTTVFREGVLLRSHTVIYAGSAFGSHFQTGHHSLIRERCKIGDDVSIGSSSVLEFEVLVGNGVRIHSQAFVPELSVLEDGAWIGPNVVLTNAKYPRSRGVKEALRGVRVCAGAKIGANATVLPGLCIGQGALVGAGAVVTRDVPDRAIVTGCPARVVGTVDDLPEYQPEG